MTTRAEQPATETSAVETTAVSGDLTAMQMCACQHVLGDHEDHGPCKRSTCGCEAFERVYSSAEMVALTGATHRQVSYWLSTGLLTDNRRLGDATQDDGWHHGSGYPLWFTAYQLDVVRLAVHLVGFGLVPSRAFAVACEVVQADAYTLTLADIWQLSIAVKPTDPSPEEGTP